MPLNEVGPRDITPEGTDTDTSHHTGTGDFTAPRAHVWSQAVSFWEVVEFTAPLLDSVKSWPLAGSIEWQQLDDTDPAKWAALLDAARHWCLRVETCQEQLNEASHDISAALDWSKFARKRLQRNEVYIPREVTL
jgi:hypothetical protein